MTVGIPKPNFRRLVPEGELPQLLRYDRDEAAATWPVRDGTNPVEGLAVLRAELDAPAMPASFLVQWILWPDQLSDWASDAGLNVNRVYNCLGGFERFAEIRNRLAARLGVTRRDIDWLVEGDRRVPSSKLPPGVLPGALEPSRDPPLASGSEGSLTFPEKYDKAEAARHWPVRDGTNPVERMAVARAERDACAMPASLLVQWVIWPEQLNEWAESEGLNVNQVYNCLGGYKRYRDIRDKLAIRLGVKRPDIDWLIEGSRRVASSKLPLRPALLPSPPATTVAVEPRPQGPADEPSLPTALHDLATDTEARVQQGRRRASGRGRGGGPDSEQMSLI